MADQATLIEKNGSSLPARPSPGGQPARERSSETRGPEAAAGQVVSSVAGFGENMLNIAELQARMAAIELRQNVDALKIAGAVLLTAGLIALASLPVVLAGAAEVLVSELGWHRGSAFLTVGLTAVGIATFAAVAAIVWLKRQPFGFPLSTEEFIRNLNWMHTVLRLSGRSPARRG